MTSELPPPPLVVRPSGRPDPSDWSDLLSPVNPFRTAKIIGDQIPVADYLRQSAQRGHPDYIMSRGELMEFLHCPSRWLKGVPTDETKSSEWGTLIDALVLDPAGFEKNFAVTPETYPDSKTGEPKPWTWAANHCKQWRADAEKDGKTVVKFSDFKAAEQAASILLADTDLADMIRTGRKQVMVIGEYLDPDTALTIPVKCLIDLVPSLKSQISNFKLSTDDSLCDLKTCCSAHTRAWPRAVFDHDYHTQAALHTDLFNKATGENRQKFRHILQENEKPFECARRELSSEFMSLGRSKYVRALKLYARCLKENFWPTYDDAAKRRIAGWAITEPEDWMLLTSEAA